MTHRTFPRIARTGGAAARLAVVLASAVLASAGCDNKAASNAAAPQTAPAGGGAGGGRVGIVDSRQVMSTLQWDAEQKRDFESARSDVDRELTTALQQLYSLVTERRKGLIAAGKLTADQIDKLNRVELDGLPLSREQKSEYLLIVQNAGRYEQAARQQADRVLGERQQAVNRMYTEAVRPAVRRAAEASGVSTVLLKEAVFYSDPSAELTNRVIDELQKVAAPRTFPPPPKLNLQQVRLDDPAQPTTGPATNPAGAATKPAR